MINLLFETTFESPIGNLGLLADESQLIELSLHGITGLSERGKPNKERFRLELNELDFYFKRKLKSFTIAFSIEASPFQDKVYKCLRSITYGETLSYLQVAKKIGHSKAYRAVGTACGKNPLPLIIPCHRVVAFSGIGGFGGGIKNKRFLLDLESN